MSALIYKIAASIFTLAVLGRIAFLLVQFLKRQLRRYADYKKVKKENDPKFLRIQNLKKKKDFDDMMEREKAHRNKVAELHYEYQGFINLSKVESDRKKLFEDKWSDWKFSNNTHKLLPCPGDYQCQCIKMFGEMSFARKSIIAKDPNFWTEGKENFWQKICHPAVKKFDICGQDLFETRQLIIAENDFNHGDDEDRSSA